NVLIAGLNGFNAVMAVFALIHGLTIANVVSLFQGVPLPDLPNTGTPLVLGVVPLAFSLALFLLPLGRAALRPLKQRAVERENGRAGLLREVLSRVQAKTAVTTAALTSAWKRAAGAEPDEKELTRVVVELG